MYFIYNEGDNPGLTRMGQAINQPGWQTGPVANSNPIQPLLSLLMEE